MSSRSIDHDPNKRGTGTGGGTWAWHPPLPLEGAHVFVFPPRPLASIRWIFSVGFLWSIVLVYVGTATFTWFFLQPSLARCMQFEPSWILEIFARNLGLIVVVAGGLHLYLYTFRKQGVIHKFELRDMVEGDRRFFGQSQVWDNIFWSCASGVTLWTAYEVFFMWGFANDKLPYLGWNENPVWFALLFVAIPFWQSAHFYVIHRWLHWKPLYRLAHSVHHRNVGIGPWSGISMHPLEHLLYLSSVLIHFVIYSHPIHILFHMQFLVLAAVQSHSGFQDLIVRNRSTLALGDFFHQLHHRYFNCNYGTDYVPLDRWFGTYHNGTQEATVAMVKLGRLKRV
jgi:Delta7-sterol 5-desaturase